MLQSRVVVYWGKARAVRVGEPDAKNNAALASNFEWRRRSESSRRGAASFRGRVCVLEEIYSGTRKASRRVAVLRYVEPVGMRKYTNSTSAGTSSIYFALATLILEGAVTTFRCWNVTLRPRETLQTVPSSGKKLFAFEFYLFTRDENPLIRRYVEHVEQKNYREHSSE